MALKPLFISRVDAGTATALALVVLLSGCSPTRPANIGDTVTAGDWKFRVDKVESRKSAPGFLFWPTDAKGQWVVVYLSLMNVGKEPKKLEWRAFDIYDETGARYSSDPNISGSFVRSKGLRDVTDTWPPEIAFESAILFDLAPDRQGLTLRLPKSNIGINLGPTPPLPTATPSPMPTPAPPLTIDHFQQHSDDQSFAIINVGESRVDLTQWCIQLLDIDSTTCNVFPSGAFIQSRQRITVHTKIGPRGLPTESMPLTKTMSVGSGDHFYLNMGTAVAPSFYDAAESIILRRIDRTHKVQFKVQ